MKKEKKLKQEADFDFSKDIEEEEVRSSSFSYFGCIWCDSPPPPPPHTHTHTHTHTDTDSWKEWKKEEKSETHQTRIRLALSVVQCFVPENALSHLYRSSFHHLFLNLMGFFFVLLFFFHFDCKNFNLVQASYFKCIYTSLY